MKSVLISVFCLIAFDALGDSHIACRDLPSEDIGLQSEINEWIGYGYKQVSDPFLIVDSIANANLGERSKHQICTAQFKSDSSSVESVNFLCSKNSDTSKINAYMKKLIANYNGNLVISKPTGFKGYTCVLISMPKFPTEKIADAELACGVISDDSRDQDFMNALELRKLSAGFDSIGFGNNGANSFQFGSNEACALLTKHR